MVQKSIALKKHSEWGGKLEIITRAPLATKEDLAIAYTPGVAEPCLEIQKDEELAYEYTGKGNLVAVITDGTAVLGLGDIGPVAGYACHGRKVCLVQEVCRYRCYSNLHRLQGF